MVVVVGTGVVVEVDVDEVVVVVLVVDDVVMMVLVPGKTCNDSIHHGNDSIIRTEISKVLRF